MEHPYPNPIRVQPRPNYARLILNKLKENFPEQLAIYKQEIIDEYDKNQRQKDSPRPQTAS